MKLTAKELRTLNLMMNLACQWEESLSLSVDDQRTIRACAANVKRFGALYSKLVFGASPTTEKKA